MSTKHQLININGKYQRNKLELMKNRTYYFLNDMINIEDSDLNLIKTDKTSYKNIAI